MEYIVAALATWRVTSLIVRERGPFGIFYRLRVLAGVDHDDAGLPYGGSGFFGELLSCVWCASVWVGAAIAVLVAGFTADAAVLALALSAFTVAFDGLLGN